MLLNSRHTNLFTNVLSVLTVVVVLLALFSNLSASEVNLNMFLCSDTLYLPCIYTDWFIDKSNMDGWHLNPAPNYFPDMPLYFLLMFITNNFILSSFLFSFIQILFLGFIFFQLFKAIFPNTSPYYKLLIYSLLTFYLLDFFILKNNFFYIFHLVSNSYHTSAFVIALVCLLFTMKYIQSKKYIWLILILVIGFLEVISDRLIVVMYVIPAGTLIIFLFKRITIKASINLLMVNLLFTVIGLYVFDKINSEGYKQEGFTTPKNLEVITHQFEVYFGQIWMIIRSFRIRAFTIYAFIITLFLMGYVFVKALKKSNSLTLAFYAGFSIVFSLGVICAPMLTGRYTGEDCIRYNIYPFYLTVLNLAVFLYYLKKSENIKRIGVYAVIGLSGFILTFGILKFNYTGLKEFFNYYPETARLVDDLAEKENLKFGVASYWDAKKITMFSKKNVKVRAVFDNVSIYLHVANENWYYNNVYNFVILNNFGDTSLYKTILRDIEVVSNTNALKLIKARPFTYKKEIGGSVVYNDK
jgi:hypothetical protein